MQNLDPEHRTCTASQYSQLHEKHNAQAITETSTLLVTVTLLNKMERIRRIVTAVTVVPKEA